MSILQIRVVKAIFLRPWSCSKSKNDRPARHIQDQPQTVLVANKMESWDHLHPRRIKAEPFENEQPLQQGQTHAKSHGENTNFPNDKRLFLLNKRIRLKANNKRRFGETNQECFEYR